MARGFQKSYRSDVADAVPDGTSVDHLRLALAARFPSPEYTLRVDDSANSVWVIREQDGRSVGIHVGSAQRRGIPAVLDSTERKLAGTVPVH